MKVVFYSLSVVIFSAIAIAPITPKEYPDRKTLDEKRVLNYKEERLNRIINTIEHRVKIDSIKIKEIK